MKHVSALIVGAGPGGTAAALKLKQQGVPREEIMIVDGHSSPLGQWESLTQDVDYLRSPSPVHLDPDNINSLEVFARRKGYKEPFKTDFGRPSNRLFMNHSRALMNQEGLAEEDVYIQGRVEDFEQDGKHFEVTINRPNKLLFKDEHVKADNMIIAVSPTEAPSLPDWAPALKERGRSVFHSSEIQPNSNKIDPDKSLVVVGGGITAAQMVINRAKENPQQKIFMLARRELTLSEFDFHHIWFDPDFVEDFKNKPLNERHNLSLRERRKGTIPPHLFDDLQALIDAKQLEIIYADIQEVDSPWYKPFAKPMTISYTDLDTGKDYELKTSQIITATGFKRGMLNTPWFQTLINKLRLSATRLKEGKENFLHPVLDPNTGEWMQQGRSVNRIIDDRGGSSRRERGTFQKNSNIFLMGMPAGIIAGPPAAGIFGHTHMAELISDSEQMQRAARLSKSAFVRKAGRVSEQVREWYKQKLQEAAFRREQAALQDALEREARQQAQMRRQTRFYC